MAAHGRAALAFCLAAALFTTGQAQMPQADAADGIEWCKQHVDESKLTVRTPFMSRFSVCISVSQSNRPVS